MRQGCGRMNRSATVDGNPRRLLVVQRNPFAARSLARYLTDDFDVVVTANDLATAEVALAASRNAPTHVVCGQHFGPGERTGTETIPAWRAKYPTLTCVVLATAHADVPATPEGVDFVFLKPASPTGLKALLTSRPSKAAS